MSPSYSETGRICVLQFGEDQQTWIIITAGVARSIVEVEHNLQEKTESIHVILATRNPRLSATGRGAQWFGAFAW